MPYDPLTQYRRTLTPDGPRSPGGATEYVAFGTKDKVHRLRIRRPGEMTHAPGYNLLLNVVSDETHGTSVILVYTVLLVKVQGRNLQKLIFALEGGMAEYIQQFDSGKWAKPTDATAPIIESIEVKITEGSSPVGELKQ